MALRRIPASRRAIATVIAIVAASAGTYLVTRTDGTQKQINISDLVPKPTSRPAVDKAIPADKAAFREHVRGAKDFDALAAMVAPAFEFAQPAWQQALEDTDAATASTLAGLEAAYRDGKIPPEKLAAAAAKAIRDEASILNAHYNAIRDEVIFRRNQLRAMAYGTLNGPFQKNYHAQLRKPPQDRDQAVLDAVRAASRRVSEIKRAAVDGANAVLAPMRAEIDRRRQPETIKPRLQAYLDRVLLAKESQP